MKKETIEFQDLLALKRLVCQLVKIQTEYLKKGYSIREVLNTFIKIYFTEISAQISPELARRLIQPSVSLPFSGADPQLTAEDFMLELTTEALSIINQNLKK